MSTPPGDAEFDEAWAMFEFEVLGPLTGESSVLRLDLGTRAYNVLSNAGIKTIADLTTHTPAELLRLTNFGTTSLAQVEAGLAKMGLHLSGWQAPPPSFRERKMVEFATWWIQHDGTFSNRNVTPRDIAMAAYLAGAQV